MLEKQAILAVLGALILHFFLFVGEGIAAVQVHQKGAPSSLSSPNWSIRSKKNQKGQDRDSWKARNLRTRGRG
jgi:hypothetical protein